MPKILATAEEITAEMQRRISASQEMGGDCRKCRALAPSPCDPRDYPGANWVMRYFDGQPAACLPVLEAIANKMREEYDLKT